MQHIEAEGTRSDRIELPVTPQEKALLMRAAAIEHLDMTSFVMRAVLPVAQEIIGQRKCDDQEAQKTADENLHKTGADLIAFFRNSPLADVALELDLERDKATSRTLTF